MSSTFIATSLLDDALSPCEVECFLCDGEEVIEAAVPGRPDLDVLIVPCVCVGPHFPLEAYVRTVETVVLAGELL